MNTKLAATPRQSKPKTRDRILARSLELFNEQGERQMSTNHIAAALGMSPGNLYYHFKNKDAIIFELFLEYTDHMRAALTLPEDRQLTQADKIVLFEKIMGTLWRYRFLHRDMTHLLDNAEMRDSYRAFARQAMVSVSHLYRLQVESGLVEATEEEIMALTTTIWITATNWVTFLSTTGFFGYAEPLTEAMLRQGLYQVICLEAPYLRGEARSGLEALKARYGAALRIEEDW
ncbi:TetR/AcrR family transcriptional regulator [Amnimonas aquatica]|uniref:TetR family transcriptional regulator n=1 Tax=Amnimonas aquatica TaxID=2094561 RepID=A0A2P6AT37_9GAMM|nr:TetR/AcrR family transcriptional regulator [Amnimonas aquatica]PQA45447.1 TetR family transcriptional regulator [Amnimonas aquatica]